MPHASIWWSPRPKPGYELLPCGHCFASPEHQEALTRQHLAAVEKLTDERLAAWRWSYEAERSHHLAGACEDFLELD